MILFAKRGLVGCNRSAVRDSPWLRGFAWRRKRRPGGEVMGNKAFFKSQGTLATRETSQPPTQFRPLSLDRMNVSFVTVPRMSAGTNGAILNHSTRKSPRIPRRIPSRVGLSVT